MDLRDQLNFVWYASVPCLFDGAQVQNTIGKDLFNVAQAVHSLTINFPVGKWFSSKATLQTSEIVSQFLPA